MSAKIVSAPEFLKMAAQKDAILFDTRSEKEYVHAHIPNALSLPLLKNEERAIVGTIYKNQGRHPAVKKGFELVGPRFHEIITEAEKNAPGKEIMIYCWRGGMRSGIMAWLLELAGFRVTLLKGGYKAFRNYAQSVFKEPRKAIILGGKTGSGKTEILHKLRSAGEQVIDLEGLANHKGSAFGSLGQPPQPSNEHFENLLAIQWALLDPKRRVWLENESRTVGSCIVPEYVFEHIRNAPLIQVEPTREMRFDRIKRDYGCFDFKQLAETTLKIKKRLGPQYLKEALFQLESGNFNEWLYIILDYYDRLYSYGNTLRAPGSIHTITIEENENDIQRIITLADKIAST